MPGTDDFAIVGIDVLPGTLGREPLGPAALPDPGTGHGLRLRRTRWRDFEIDVLAGRATQDGMAISVLVAQVPLAPRAVQLEVAGPAEREHELEDLLETLLRSLEGRTNWLSSEERWAHGAPLVLGALLVLGLGIWAALRRRKRTRPASGPR